MEQERQEERERDREERQQWILVSNENIFPERWHPGKPQQINYSLVPCPAPPVRRIELETEFLYEDGEEVGRHGESFKFDYGSPAVFIRQWGTRIATVIFMVEVMPLPRANGRRCRFRFTGQDIVPLETPLFFVVNPFLDRIPISIDCCSFNVQHLSYNLEVSQQHLQQLLALGQLTQSDLEQLFRLLNELRPPMTELPRLLGPLRRRLNELLEDLPETEDSLRPLIGCMLGH
jgi:hypothetical protein